MDELFKFIKDRFLSMPQWVQVSTYVSFVMLFIYLFTAPRFLDMRLVSHDYGDEFPIGGAQIEIEIEGRVLILLTDSKGRFSVPISTNYPLGTYLFILSPDPGSNKIKEIEVPFSNSYLKRSKIIYSKKTNDYKIIPNGIIENATGMFASLDFIGTAHADNDTPEAKDGIDDEILKALEVITKIPFRQIPLDVSLRDDLEIDNIDLSYISNRLNRKYKIDCLSAFQHNAETVEDLIVIARSKYHKKQTVQQKIPVPLTVKQMATTSQQQIPDDVMTKYKLGRILRKSGRNKAAATILEQVVEKQPQFYLGWFNLALAYEGMDNMEKAKRAFDKAIEISTEKNLEDANLYNAYGMFLFRQEKYKEAAEQFKKEKQLKTSPQ